MCFSSCSLFAKSAAPYFVTAEMTMEESSNYSIAGLRFGLMNKADKEIKEFTMVFCFFDEDGNPVVGSRNNQVITVSTQIHGKEFFEACISLDKYLYEIPEEPYQIDFLYVSRIVYDDDSVWTDPFGLTVF